jgi:hypothetical protein
VSVAPDSIRVVESQLDAYNRRDLEAFLSHYDKDASIFNFPSPVSYASGVGGLRDIYGKIFGENPRLHCEIVNRISLGSFVIDQEKVTGFSARPDLDAVAIYQVAGTLITNVWLIK